MIFEDFVLGMNGLGLKVTHSGKMKDKNGVSQDVEYGSMFQNGKVSVTVRVDFEDTNNFKGANLNIENTNYGFKLSDFGCNSLEEVYNFLRDNESVVNMDFDEDKISKKLNSIVDYVNVELAYSPDSIDYIGFISEEKINFLLTDYLSYYSVSKTLQEEFELYVVYILNEERYENKSTVEDMHDFLTDVKGYVKRVDGRELELEEIFNDIINSGEYYEKPESVVEYLYDLPILEEDYNQEVIRETPKELAKKIRSRLKKEFKDTKFSVKSSIDSGGVVRVEWLNYPYESKVEDIIREYNSKYSKNTYGDYGNDSQNIGYIDPEDGLRYEGVRYLQVRQELSGEYKELMDLITDYRLLNFRELEEQEYLEHHNGNKRVVVRSIESVPEFYEISSDTELQDLLKEYKELFYNRFCKEVNEVLTKRLGDGYEVDIPKDKVRITGLDNEEKEFKVTIKENDRGKEDVNRIEEIINDTPLFRAYKIKVKLVGENSKEKVKTKDYNFSPNRDGKDSIRVRRFVSQLNDLGVEYGNFETPDGKGWSIVVNISDLMLTMNPMFVISLGKNKGLLYSKHRDDDIKKLPYILAKLCKEKGLSREDTERVSKVLEAYNLANDLRKKVN